jgi:hypothetical protein
MKKTIMIACAVLGIFWLSGNVWASTTEPSVEDIIGPGWVEMEDWTSLPDGTYTYTLVAEYAGFADTNEFGIKDGDIIFPGEADETYSPQNAGNGPFYLNDFYSDSDEDSYRFRFFDHPTEHGYMIAMEDFNDNDFNDMVVKATPIPGAVWLFASGLAGIVGLRKKFKK